MPSWASPREMKRKPWKLPEATTELNWYVSLINLFYIFIFYFKCMFVPLDPQPCKE